MLCSGILHGAGLWQLPKQLYLPAEEKSALASNSHLKYVWYDPEAVKTSLPFYSFTVAQFSLL